MAKKSVDKVSRVDQVIAKMRDNGYVPAPEIAEQLHRSLPTISKWAEEGLVESMMVSHRRFLKLESVIDHIGEDQARIFGLLPKAPKAKRNRTEGEHT